MPTIHRNSKRARQVFNQATSYKVCNLHNCFRPESCPLSIKDWLWKRYQDARYAKLRENGNGLFTLRFHSNLWYYIESPA